MIDGAIQSAVASDGLFNGGNQLIKACRPGDRITAAHEYLQFGPMPPGERYRRQGDVLRLTHHAIAQDDQPARWNGLRQFGIAQDFRARHGRQHREQAG